MDLSDFVAGARPDVEGPKAVYCQGKVNGSPVWEEPTGNKKKTGSAVATAWRTVVTKDRKLTVRGNWDQIEHLFDLEADPFERNDLSKDPKYQPEIAQLIKDLKLTAEETGDSFPIRPGAAKQMYTDKEAEDSRLS